MKISHNWLCQYINIEETPEEVADLLTSIGLEVEGVESFESIKGGLEGMVVGQVIEKYQHPDADRLSCTKVDIGDGDPLPIVCGAPNVAEGQKVIVATVGAMLYPEQGEPFEIKKAKIRGEVSQGMICAEDEIGVGTSHDGIMVLPEDTELGIPAAQLFELEFDTVYEIGLTPNRADAASHFGVARDLRAAFAHRKNRAEALVPAEITLTQVVGESRTIPVEVENTEACPRYCGITVSDIQVGPSPAWLANRLKAIGVRPINNVVDVTNYINHAFGQPLHAFDVDKIEGQKVVVRTMKHGSKFTTLDEVERTLDQADLMICDANAGMCIAGVFGGANSGVSASTTSIFLESAYFNPVWVRKTAKRHGLHTDASFRFERGIDPNITAYCAQLAAQMIVEVAGGRISSTLSDTQPNGFPDFKVQYRVGAANRFIGIDIPESATERILENLDVKVSKKEGESWTLSVPSFKVDVTREADVIEEVLRIYGYDEVPFTAKMNSTIKDMKPKQEALATEATTQLLVSNGFQECMSNSMIDAKSAALSNAWKTEEVVELNNPLSSEMGIMRPALVFSALQNASYNLNRQQSNIKQFEFGNIYRGSKNGFSEESRLAILVSGNQISDSWRLPDTPADWYFLKATLEQILIRLGIDLEQLALGESGSDWFDYGLDWKHKNNVVITAGSVGKALRSAFDIKRDVFYLEVRWAALIALRRAAVNIGYLPKYPSVRRDLALLVDRGIHYSELERLAFQTERKLLQSVNLFDVYQGKGLAAGKKSYALAFTLRDDQKTLTDKEVDKTMKRLLDRYIKEVGAELRA